jgi:hypothetical protein
MDAVLYFFFTPHVAPMRNRSKSWSNTFNQVFRFGVFCRRQTTGGRHCHWGMVPLAKGYPNGSNSSMWEKLHHNRRSFPFRKPLMGFSTPNVYPVTCWAF